MKPLIIVQARTGSTRFPCKVLAPLRGKPVIKHVLDACHRTNLPTIVTIPISDAGGPLPAYLASLGQRWHMAAVAEDDVLGRFAAVLREYPMLSRIVRITADCPLVDHRSILEMIALQGAMEGNRYLGRANRPDGNDVEVFTADFLREADAKTPIERREHVVHWLATRVSSNDATFWASEDTYEDVKYSVDVPADLQRCEELLDIAGETAPWLSYVNALRPIKVEGIA